MSPMDPIKRQARAEHLAEVASDKRNQLSGNTYVSVILREDEDKYPRRDYLRRIPATTPDKCHHGITICSEMQCMSSWAIDYRLFLSRTVAGRRLAADAGWDCNIELTNDLTTDKD